MTRQRYLSLTLILTLLGPARAALALGAYELEEQYTFPVVENVSVVAPFVDGQGRPWVLANQAELGECHLIGPFDQDDPPTQVFRLPDREGEPTPTQCLNVEAGPDGGFFIRAYIPPPMMSEEPPYGHLVLVDSDFEIVWTIEDEPQTELGSYGEPLPPIAWSAERGRVITFFLGFASLGADVINQLHGMSITDTTGLIRRTISSWGTVSSGELQALLVMPTAGDFLVIAHANGTELLVYNGLENISAYGGGDIDWSGESVAHAQFAANTNLYVIHFPRLDMGGIDAQLTSLSEDGEAQYYSRDLARSVNVEQEGSEELVTVSLVRPVLSYVTDSTVTLVRSATVEYVLHVFDNFNGLELAIQPLASVDENTPTHMADARSPDRLILLTYDAEEEVRLLDVLAWDGSLPTPGPYGGGEVPSEGAEPGADTGLDSGTSDGGSSGGGGGDDEDEGCSLAGRPTSSAWLVGLALVGLLIRKRWSRS